MAESFLLVVRPPSELPDGLLAEAGDATHLTPYELKQALLGPRLPRPVLRFGSEAEATEAERALVSLGLECRTIPRSALDRLDRGRLEAVRADFPVGGGVELWLGGGQSIVLHPRDVSSIFVGNVDRTYGHGQLQSRRQRAFNPELVKRGMGMAHDEQRVEQRELSLRDRFVALYRPSPAPPIVLYASRMRFDSLEEVSEVSVVNLDRTLRKIEQALPGVPVDRQLLGANHVPMIATLGEPEALHAGDLLHLVQQGPVAAEPAPPEAPRPPPPRRASSTAGGGCVGCKGPIDPARHYEIAGRPWCETCAAPHLPADPARAVLLETLVIVLAAAVGLLALAYGGKAGKSAVLGVGLWWVFHDRRARARPRVERIEGDRRVDVSALDLGAGLARLGQARRGLSIAALGVVGLATGLSLLWPDRTIRLELGEPAALSDAVDLTFVGVERGEWVEDERVPAARGAPGDTPATFSMRSLGPGDRRELFLRFEADTDDDTIELKIDDGAEDAHDVRTTGGVAWRVVRSDPSVEPRWVEIERVEGEVELAERPRPRRAIRRAHPGVEEERPARVAPTYEPSEPSAYDPNEHAAPYEDEGEPYTGGL